jgi:8-oxo-dGTP pyrophosphatase MutT (NUDIX family)
MGMSDYVRDVRGKLGRDLLLMPAVGGLLRDERGRVLLVQHVEGRWQLPGGAVDPDESPDESIRREALEEARIVVEPVGLLGAFGGPEYRITYSNGDEAAYVVTVYELRLVDGEPVPGDDETQAVGWFLPEEIDALEVAPSTRRTLDALLRAS